MVTGRKRAREDDCLGVDELEAAKSSGFNAMASPPPRLWGSGECWAMLRGGLDTFFRMFRRFSGTTLTALRLDGFRVLRSKKEYSAFSREPDITLSGLSAVQLLSFGLKLQEDAYLLDDTDEVVPPAAVPSPLRSARAGPCSPLPLSNLFADVSLPLSLGDLSNAPLPKRVKESSPSLPSSSLPSAASGKSRQKAQYRAKRRDARIAQQTLLGSAVKAVAQRSYQRLWPRCLVRTSLHLPTVSTDHSQPGCFQSFRPTTH
ncbi:hypothetical protein EV361DRAFT_125303 [Lentinula raphanica]|nr:hypothetical protein EV361DRAFT_125303 [Lentinula raphanica]